MHRIDGPGATITNLWTEGNPAGGIPATTVTDDWMNDCQEEICNLIEAQGIALVKGDQGQLEQAIALMIAGGGAPADELEQTVINNQVAVLSITGLSFDKADFKAGRFAFDLFRRTDSSALNESGEVIVSHDTETDTWTIDWSSSFDDAGVTFSINASGQVQYVSTDLAGASYSGTIRVNNIKKIKQ